MSAVPKVRGLPAELYQPPAGPRDIRAWPSALDLQGIAQRLPEAPKFIMDDWLPCGYATLLAGHGGVGKSGIALHLAVCIAAGLPFFGQAVSARRVVYLSCEDREGVLHWRLDRICRHLGISLAELHGKLFIFDLVGQDCVLWERDPRTGHAYTAAMGLLEERLKAAAAEVLVVDGISDTFAGNENARADVKRYVNSLVSLIPAQRGAVLLVGHIAKPTASSAATSEGYSGSTGWHNSVRARWYLYPETMAGEAGERPERTGELLLELQKSNLGRTDQSMRFRWDDALHMFLGERIGASAFDRKHQDRTEREAILRAFKACADAAADVPAATTGRRTAFHVLSCRLQFPETLRSGKSGTRRFWRLIEELRAMNMLREDDIRRKDRHFVRVYVLTQEGVRACGQ